MQGESDQFHDESDQLTSYGRQLSVLAERHGDEQVLVHVRTDGTERAVSWRELDTRANQVGRLLQAAGVRQGSTVVVALHNSAEHYFCTFGSWKLGATVLPLRWDLPHWERDRLLTMSRPAAVIADWDEAQPGTLTIDDVAKSEREDDAPLPDRVADPSRIIATSGSTGSPKLIAIPGPGLIDTDPTTTSAATATTGVREGAVQLVLSPLYHTNGFASYPGLLSGQRLVVMEHFDAALAVQLIERHKANMAIMVPTMLQRIVRLPGVTPRSFESVEAIMYGGAPLAPWIARAWFDLVGPEHFFFSYGGTESIGLAMARGDEWLAHEATVGKPVACDLRILGDDGEDLPIGEVGRIFMRQQSGLESFAYVGADMPERTPDGFTTFGDMGRVDADGYLYIVDRRVDMLITGGANVYPAEVELALSEHRGVADSVVVGLPDPEWGQRVHALVEPADWHRPPSADELSAHCRERLAAYKVPKSFRFLPRIPRSAAGKVNRAALAAEHRHTSEEARPDSGERNRA